MLGRQSRVRQRDAEANELKGRLRQRDAEVNELKDRLCQRGVEVNELEVRFRQRDADDRNLQRQVQEIAAQLHEAKSESRACHQRAQAKAMEHQNRLPE